jgi:hypothetical protein
VTDRPPPPATAAPALDGRAVEAAVEDAVDEAVDERVEEAVDERVEEAVDERVEDVLAQAGTSAERADEARSGAEQARDDARQAGTAAGRGRQPRRAAGRPAARHGRAPPRGRRRRGQPLRPPRPAARPRSPFRIAFSAAMGVAVAYGLVRALISVQSVLVLLLTAAFLAIALDPAVEALERRHVRRSLAVTAVLAVVLLFFVAFGFAVVPPIVEQGQAIVAQPPTT